MNEIAETEILIYHIRLDGHLDPRWSGWFDGMAITLLDCGETQLSGPVVDQTALHGLLAKIRDMNLKLISLTELHSQTGSGDSAI